MPHIEEKVKEIVLAQLGVVVSKETKLSEIVEDSLSKIDLLFEIETSLDVTIPPDEILDIETIGELVKAINDIQISGRKK